MATANSSRPVRRRARSVKQRASPASRRSKTTTVRAKRRPDLYGILSRFSDAIAFVETACRALDAADEEDPRPPIAPELLTLGHGLKSIRRVYTELDLAILNLRE